MINAIVFTPQLASAINLLITFWFSKNLFWNHTKMKNHLKCLRTLDTFNTRLFSQYTANSDQECAVRCLRLHLWFEYILTLVSWLSGLTDRTFNCDPLLDFHFYHTSHFKQVRFLKVICLSDLWNHIKWGAYTRKEER